MCCGTGSTASCGAGAGVIWVCARLGTWEEGCGGVSTGGAGCCGSGSAGLAVGSEALGDSLALADEAAVSLLPPPAAPDWPSLSWITVTGIGGSGTGSSPTGCQSR